MSLSIGPMMIAVVVVVVVVAVAAVAACVAGVVLVVEVLKQDGLLELNWLSFQKIE